MIFEGMVLDGIMARFPANSRRRSAGFVRTMDGLRHWTVLRNQRASIQPVLHTKTRHFTFPTFDSLTDTETKVRVQPVSTITKIDSVWFTTKGQVVIPAWLRKQFDIEDGTKAVVQATPEGILLKPVTAALIKQGRGIIKRKAGDKSLAEEWANHKREEQELEDRHVR